MKKILVLSAVFLLLLQHVLYAQSADSAADKKFSIHVQSTLIPQYHFDFNSPYQGANSHLPHEPARTSFTGTLFAAYKLARHSYIVLNPEVAGGKGLSKTLGIAGFPNGEIYRVGDPQPKPYIARLYVEQRFPLSSLKEFNEDDINQIQEHTNRNYIAIIAGKFSLTDFFGNIDVSHDPRTQFLNWSLMGHGAWDYPANTRGYTFGVSVLAFYKNWFFKYANTFVPTEANGMNLQWKGDKAMGMVLEAGRNNLFNETGNSKTGFHAGIFWNRARMGNYKEALGQADTMPDITKSRVFGRSKWGYYAGLDNKFDYMHISLKASWNDGHNETWAFTEIDRSVGACLQFDGNIWKRKDDWFGLAFVQNNLSPMHRQYLAKGGYGFLIGDAKLNYGAEQIVEAYYSFSLLRHVYISPDYQLVVNPAYNKDRGPVHLVALRLHVEF